MIVPVLPRAVFGAALTLAAASVSAISGNEQVRLAGEGRFDLLAQRLEAENAGPTMSTADRHGLCFAYSRLKDYAKLDVCLEALERSARRGELRTRLFGLDDVTPAIHIMRAEAAIDLARYAEAVTSAKQALAWYERERSNDRDIEVAALSVLVISAQLSRDKGAAENAYARLQRVDVSWPRFHNHANAKAFALARAGIALERYDQALAALEENKGFAFQVFLDNLLSGAAMRGRSNWAWQELPRAYIAARALLGLRRQGKAKVAYDQLLKLPELPANGEIYWLALFDRACLAEEEADESLAIDLYRQAIDVIEVQRASINTEANKIGFIGNRQAVYQRLIRLLLKRQEAAQALEYVERSKSRALIDMLASRLRTPDAVHAEGQTVQALSTFLDAEAHSLRQVPLATRSVDPRERQGRLQQATEQLRTQAPQLAALLAVDRMPLAELQAHIAPDETMLQLYVGGDAGAVFVVTRADVKVYGFDAVGLEESVRQFRVALEKRSRTIAEISAELYRRLFGHALAEVKTSSLLIVPHGPLHYLAFAALHDGIGYLVDRFAIRTLPTATVLRYLGSGATASASMLVLGNPDLGNPDYDLPNAQFEAETIAKSTRDGQLLLRKDASETAFIEQAGRYRYIHVASHGEFDAARPLDSALLLAPDARNDGNLTVAELYRLRLGADLIALSACETGLGQVTNGDDVVGLTRGFLYAGASSILASLWNVHDRATSLLMRRFYAGLASGDKHHALRMAQIETRQQYPHPYFWAAFYLVGSEK